uniref:Uncharacterized protein n=1 Tax=Meloidogyne enterolobii TaxID=390850 RepID=A0A6V7W661_MELEN|nr:unnamed protein product [Meloidogyne enterolobii]
MLLNILIINFIILTIKEFNFAKATTQGFDSVQNISTQTFTQAKSSANFFIGRVFNGALFDIPSDGTSLESAVDQAGIQNMLNANSAGLDVDAYFVPRYAQLNENIDAQIDYTLKAISDANLQLKTIWVVILNNLHSGWTEDAQSNVDCLTRFLTQFKVNFYFKG